MLVLLLPQPVTPQEVQSQAHESVGRLNQAGYNRRQHCTAWLIAQDTALTAAHCLNAGLNSPLFLVLGYDRGIWDQALPVGDVLLPQGGADIMALCLDDQAVDAEAFPLAETPPQQGESVEIWGYGSPSVHVLRRTTCEVLVTMRADGDFSLRCPASPGASGGPVFRMTGTGPEALGVISRTSGAVTIATPVTALPDAAAECTKALAP